MTTEGIYKKLEEIQNEIMDLNALKRELQEVLKERNLRSKDYLNQYVIVTHGEDSKRLMYVADVEIYRDCLHLKGKVLCIEADYLTTGNSGIHLYGEDTISIISREEFDKIILEYAHKFLNFPLFNNN